MSIWQRWFGKVGPEKDAYDDKQGESQLKTELRHLHQQRLSIEQQGCFSDRELAEKDCQLEEIDRRINAVKKQQFRLHTRVRLHQ